MAGANPGRPPICREVARRLAAETAPRICRNCSAGSTRFRPRSFRPARRSTRRFSAPSSRMRCPTRISACGRCRSTATAPSGPISTNPVRSRMRRSIAATSPRMRDVPRYFDEQIANMRAGLARGFSVPRATLEGRDASIAAFLADDSRQEPVPQGLRHHAGDHPGGRTAGAAGARRSRDRARRSSPPIASCSISSAPNICRRRGPRSRPSDLPDGDAFYRAQIREYTTLDLSPEEIHQIGLKRGCPDRRPDAADHARQRLQGLVRGLPQLPQDRPAIRREYTRRAARRFGLRRQARPTMSSAIISGFCRAGGSGSSRSPTRSRPSTRRAAAGSRIA